MLLGELDLGEFSSDTLAIIFFVVYMFLVVVLLANVLIALVVDSYGVIKIEQAETVFWSNRLEYVAEIHILRLLRYTLFIKKIRARETEEDGRRQLEDDPEPVEQASVTCNNEDDMREFWQSLIDTFDYSERKNALFISFEFWMHTALRIVTAIVIIPMWIIVGILSAGWLWPPQVRERLFRQKLSKSEQTPMHDDDNIKSTHIAILEDQRRLHIHFQTIRKNTQEFHSEMNMDFCNRRDQVHHVRKEMKSIRNDMMKEMKEIKQVLSMMFEQHTSSI